jgi:hypothetical protein
MLFSLFHLIDETKEAGVLENFRGVVAMNGCLCSLSFKDWRLLIHKKDRNMEEKNKQNILNQVKVFMF